MPCRVLPLRIDSVFQLGYFDRLAAVSAGLVPNQIPMQISVNHDGFRRIKSFCPTIDHLPQDLLFIFPIPRPPQCGWALSIYIHRILRAGFLKEALSKLFPERMFAPFSPGFPLKTD